MAFSFRAGTNWYHDFPKLARESGFYFNAHTARVRVDWNRISTIDIDRVIRERDFQTVDDNVNNVIDYYLESEYDVKILDPNFVKLFRLAQLAVEYLLYCKQYLDQSVVILKEELKYKLEENVKLKDEVTRLQENMKEMKERYKEKSKAVELKSDTESHKCPHCPKTFVSASFANAHLVRRHSNLSDVLSNSSPAHDGHRAETEKLHNEIKMLKERLNQTERVIRNESNNNNINRISDIAKRERLLSSIEDGDSSFHDDQYRRCQEEISNLKTMLFTEFRNIKKKENNYNYQGNEINHETIKELVSQQESEIQRLRNQLQEHLTSNANEVETKLVKQEEFWKSKIEQLENQHHKDIENLFNQLKITQESATRIKSDYEEKVTVLEKQSMDQSKLLNTQTEKLHNLSKELLDSKKQSDHDVPKLSKQKIDSFVEDTFDNEFIQNVNKSVKKSAVKVEQQTKSNQCYNKLFSSNKKSEDPRKIKLREEIIIEPAQPKYKEKKSQKSTSHKKIVKAGNKYSSLEESGKSETSSLTGTDTETEEDSDEETSESSYTRTESTNDDTHSDLEEELEMIDYVNHQRRRSSLASLGTVKSELQEAFEDKLRDLGIDPEWNGVPAATFNQKIEKIKHQQNINSKKFPRYEQIRRKLIDEVSKRISINQKSPKKFEYEKKSFLNKAVKNVKSKALKAFNELKIQKNNDTSTPVTSSKNSTPRESQTKRRFSLELLPKKPTHQDIQEIKRQVRLDSTKKQKVEETTPKKKSNYHNEESIRQQVVETILEPPKPRTKQLQRSYQSVDEFLKDIEDATKLDIPSTKVTSTPSRNIKDILQDTYPFGSELDSQMNKHDASWALASPKNSKSVLKSTNGTMGSLIKKKVLFHLEKENSPNKESTFSKSAGELIMENLDEKKELNESDWNISSISKEKETITVQEKNASNENIQLKTSQSEKIAEISRRIQEKLEASRKKPIGSIETMFTAKTFLNDQDEIKPVHENQTSFLENSSSHVELKPRNPSQVPRPAPRKQLFGTKDPDLDSDKDSFLAIS